MAPRAHRWTTWIDSHDTFSIEIFMSGLIKNEYATPENQVCLQSWQFLQFKCLFLYYDATQQPILRRSADKADDNQLVKLTIK